jgi:hypothetical protein
MVCDRVRVDTLPTYMYQHGLHMVRCMCGEMFGHVQKRHAVELEA